MKGKLPKSADQGKEIDMAEKNVYYRSMRYSPRPRVDATAWQKEVRRRLARLLRVEDLQASKGEIALNPEEVFTEKRDGCALKEIEISSTPSRRMKLIVTTPLPLGRGDRFPAVVCIHGHGGGRHVVYEDSDEYKGFARCLAQRGYITISANGQ